MLVFGWLEVAEQLGHENDVNIIALRRISALWYLKLKIIFA